MNADSSKAAWPPVRFERRPWDYGSDLPVPRRVRTALADSFTLDLAAQVCGGAGPHHTFSAWG